MGNIAPLNSGDNNPIDKIQEQPPANLEQTQAKTTRVLQATLIKQTKNTSRM